MGGLRFVSLQLRRGILPYRWASSRRPDFHSQVCRYKSSSSDFWIVKSPFSDVDIPDISLSKYVFEAQEPFAGKTAMVSYIVFLHLYL